MDLMLLTQNSTPIFKYVVRLLGLIMNIIFEFLDLIGIPNIGLSIILFTIVVYLLLMPLTIKQQKFSKLSARMNPEIQAIQEKYKGKQDNESMMAMNTETRQVYAKYGVSPSGSCVQLLIQMPILFALYRVIYQMPAYVTKLGNAFGVLADRIMSATDGVDYVKSMSAAAMYTKNFEIAGNTRNAVIDVLNKASTTDMAALSDKFGLADLTYEGSLILSNDSTRGLIDTYNNFLGLNIGNTPMDTITSSFATGNYLLLLGAVSIPVLAALTQWLNYKLMPQASNDDNNKKKNQSEFADSMQQSMKMMNTIMPIMSAWFCLTLPAGMGLYWVIGAVVRSIQQVLINKHIDKMDMDAEIKKNIEKYNEKLRKQGIDPAKLNAAAKTNTKNIAAKTTYKNNSSANKVERTEEEKAAAIKASTEYYNKNAKPGSLAAKANMVKQYNEKNNK